jgi:hypothetical protein
VSVVSVRGAQRRFLGMGWKRWFHGVVTLAIFCCAGAAGAQTLYVLNAHGPVQVIEYDTKAPKAPLPAPDTVLDAHNMTIHIDYRDGDAILGNGNIPTGATHPAVGFADPDAELRNSRRARLEETLLYLARVLNVDPALNVVLHLRVAASLDVGPPNFLAQGGTPFANAGGGFSPGLAFLKLTTGTQPFPEIQDMQLTVDFGHNWYFGACEPAANEMDFRSVLLHEFTHGLGFTSGLDADGSSTIGGLYTVFDSAVARESDASHLVSGTPPAFVGSALDLTSNALVFDGVEAFDLYAQGVRPPLYAPDPFALGSSIAHWSTASVPPILVGGGVMEPVFFNGNVLRNYRPVDLGALVDLGYTRIDLVAAQEETMDCGGKPGGTACHAGGANARAGGGTLVALSLCLLCLAARRSRCAARQ